MKPHAALFIASAPEQRRNQIIAAVDHEAREAHRRICARPTAIKKIKVGLAEKAIGLIEDPSQLAAVAAVDRRIAIKAAINQHPLWIRVPHDKLCSVCAGANTDNPFAAITDAAGFLDTVNSLSGRCPVLLVKALDALDAIEPEQARAAWQSLQGLLLGSSALQVAVAAGRAAYVDGDITRGWTDRDVIRLLWAEPFVTTGLLKTMLNQRSALPTHWQPSETHWLEVLRQQARVLVRSDYGPGTDFFCDTGNKCPPPNEHWCSAHAPLANRSATC